ETVEEPEATEEIILGEHEIICPSCSSVIPDDQEKCPECWTDLSLYVRCPECSLLSPAGDNQCRECFAPFEVPETPEPESEYIMDDDGGIPDIHIPDEVEITEELREEMTSLEVQEEQGKECLVCGAIFGPEDLVCPICGIEYGVEVEEPVMPETTWEAMEVEVHPTIHTCPNCSENITGLEATEREINEGKWFYRGLITIFTGIFFTSFSIWARGVSVEEQSLGLHPPPTDIVLNLLGWILVIMGAVFWFMSWRLHDERSECHHCGIETEPGMAICINCGTNLIGEAGEDDEFMDEEIPEEDIPLDETMEAEMPVDEFPQYDENGTMPDIIDDIEQKDMEIPPEMQAEEDMFLPPEGDIQTEEDVFLPQEPEMQAEADMPPETKFTHGEELPTEHEEHKKCPGCGIFVELTDTICPICDTEFGVEAISAEVPSEETEMENIDAKTPRGECPSCGAELESGTKSCPICEYPIDQ
ncbi:MAG: zinc ribbon domain-containing protein, partial [Thermoplasmata archaeon]|nr:zinc ribbon domain-containing protein [Thermoplasmata archaeon]